MVRLLFARGPTSLHLNRYVGSRTIDEGSPTRSLEGLQWWRLPVSLYPELVVFVSLENFVPFVGVGNMAINVGWKLSEDFHMFLELVLLENALFVL